MVYHKNGIKKVKVHIRDILKKVVRFTLKFLICTFLFCFGVFLLLLVTSYFHFESQKMDINDLLSDSFVCVFEE
jgi:Trk-type K+ transport system membrane component